MIKLLRALAFNIANIKMCGISSCLPILYAFGSGRAWWNVHDLRVLMRENITGHSESVIACRCYVQKKVGEGFFRRVTIGPYKILCIIRHKLFSQVDDLRGISRIFEYHYIIRVQTYVSLIFMKQILGEIND